MAAGVKTVDHGYDALLKRVFSFAHPQIAIGILEAAGAAAKRGDKNGAVTVLDVATWMEFGTDTVPARSFIRAWFDEASPQMRADLARLMQGVLKGTHTKEQILEMIGMRGVAGVQARMAEGIGPPLAESTIKAKGSSTPLIDTGQLRSSVSFAVREGK